MLYRRRLILSVLSVFVSLTAVAQPYQRALRRNFWNDGVNVAGIRQDSVSLSYAQLSASCESGEFHRSWEAESSLSAGACAATIKHLDNFSMTGSFGFGNTSLKGMCGSMFINPWFYPFDVVEFTPGDKTLQTYSFSGGISSDLSDAWRLGGIMTFESSNYAKRKDLRHTNYRLDMTVAPSIQWHNDRLAIGLSYVFSKNSETVDAEQIGSAVASYDAFFDKGLGYGTDQIWTGSGVHLSESGVSGLPVRESINGGAVQMSYKGFYADFRIRTRKGLCGEKQTIWYRFDGYDITSHLGFRTGNHQFRTIVDFLSQTNNETVLDKVTQGGITINHEYGSNELFSRSRLSARPEYRYDTEAMEICADAGYALSKSLVSTMYPFIHYRSLHSLDAGLSAIYHNSSWDLSLSGRFSRGFSSERDRKTSIRSGVSSYVTRLETVYHQDLDYETAPALTAGAGLRYNFSGGLFAELSASVVRNFGPHYYFGLWRNTLSIKTGYNF